MQYNDSLKQAYEEIRTTPIEKIGHWSMNRPFNKIGPKMLDAIALDRITVKLRSRKCRVHEATVDVCDHKGSYPVQNRQNALISR